MRLFTERAITSNLGMSKWIARWTSTSATVEPLKDPLQSALWETMYRCKSTSRTLPELVDTLSPSSLAAIFKHGKGLDGFLKDIGGQHLSMSRREDGMLILSTTTEGQSHLANHATMVAELETRLRQEVAQSSNVTNAARADVLALVAQIETLWDAEDTTSYKSTNDVYFMLYKGNHARQHVKYKDFLAFLTSHPEHFWLHKTLMRPRRPSDTEAPKLPASAANSYLRVTTATSSNNYGGWGAANNVPTAADVYEILKYIPVHWGNLGNIQIPPDVRKKHMRIASFLQWLRRQPKYFEVRNMAGTIEVRRSVLLHPDQHGFPSRDAAEQWLDTQVFAGEHNNVTASCAVITNGGSNTLSAAAATLLKFVLRVVPGYYAPASLIFKRYSKKNTPFSDIHNIICEHASQFEALKLHNGEYVYRRRTGGSNGGGASAVAFQAAFDEINQPEGHDTRILLSLMSFSCPLWDRPEYLYVRLPDEDKTLVGGFEGMVALMRSRPRLFVVGEQYYRRNDLSNPLASSVEPTDLDQMVVQAEENSYLTPREVAQVFHYVCPEDQAVPVSHFVECSSPAIRAVLPPRVMSLIELFPDFFSWREVSPGVFTIRKVTEAPAATTATSRPGHTPIITNKAPRGKEVVSAEEALDEIVALVPDEGVELSLLESWLSMRVSSAAVQHNGSVTRFLSAYPSVLTVGPPNKAGEKLVTRTPTK